MMRSVRSILAVAAAGFLPVLPATAAGSTLQLQSPPPVAKEAVAMPLIANPSDDAERRINAALKRLDANLRKAIRDCKGHDGSPGDWVRKVEPTMRGPGYLSYVIRDMSFCGGAYPPSGTMAIVYDLETGDSSGLDAPIAAPHDRQGRSGGGNGRHKDGDAGLPSAIFALSFRI